MQQTLLIIVRLLQPQRPQTAQNISAEGTVQRCYDVPKIAYSAEEMQSSSFFSVPARWRSANTTVTVSLMRKLHQMP